MSKSNKTEEVGKVEVKKPQEPKAKKSLHKEKYILIERVSIGKTDFKKGDYISATKEGKNYLKSINKIK